MIRRALLFFLLIFAFGCASVEFPAYVQDKNPYSQRYYAEYAEVLEAVKKSLNDFGWQVEGTADPVVYEQGRVAEPGSQNILLFTQVRQSSKMLWTSYVRLNVIISSKNKVSDVELRYAKINSFTFKKFKKFRNDKLSKKIHQRISEYLNQP